MLEAGGSDGGDAARAVPQCGGPYDDEAFTSGWRLGNIAAALAHPGFSAVADSIRPDERLQADLLAMASGYTMTVEHGSDGEWLSVTFTASRREPTAVVAMRILLLCSAFNGLSQRAWIELRGAGHEVTVELAVSEAAIMLGGRAVRSRPDHLPVPARAGARRGVAPPPDDHRAPRTEGRSRAVLARLGDHRRRAALGCHRAAGRRGDGRRPDLGDPRRSRCPPNRRAKSAVYNGPVADAAIELIGEVVDKAADPTFVPEPLDDRRPDVIGRLRPAMRAADRQFSWADDTATIVRRIRAADGSPGVRTTLCDVPVSVFDAHAGPALPGEPGTIVRRHHDAVLVRTGDGSVWIGQVRTAESGVKLPATRRPRPPPGPRDRGAAAARPAERARRSSGDQLPAARRRRRAELRLLQRGDVDRPVPAAGRRAAARRRTAHQGAA